MTETAQLSPLESWRSPQNKLYLLAFKTETSTALSHYAIFEVNYPTFRGIRKCSEKQDALELWNKLKNGATEEEIVTLTLK